MPEEIFALIMFSIVAVLILIRAGLKHDKEMRLAKYAAERTAPDADRDALAAKVARLEQRLAVVERIATDPAERLSAEIDDLARIENKREHTEA